MVIKGVYNGSGCSHGGEQDGGSRSVVVLGVGGGARALL